jgi:surfactin synthase thioesterase subunit
VVSDELWIRRYEPAQEGAVRLVCLPHAGGSASFFLPVARALAPAVDVLAVQYPGRQDRHAEKCVSDVRELAGHVFDVLKSWTDGPLALFGHSMGASVAFELALLLERELGVSPVVLFASGRRAPSRHREETVHLRDDEGLVAEMKRLSGTDARVLGNEDLLRMVLPAIRSDYRAAETYRYQPGPKLKCAVTALVGDADPKVSVDEARAWTDHTEGAFELHTFTGGHFYLVDELAAVLTVLSDGLSRAERGTSWTR